MTIRIMKMTDALKLIVTIVPQSVVNNVSYFVKYFDLIWKKRSILNYKAKNKQK